MHGVAVVLLFVFVIIVIKEKRHKRNLFLKTDRNNIKKTLLVSNGFVALRLAKYMKFFREVHLDHLDHLDSALASYLHEL